jgi:molybdenum cofactor cytidylyltransferase
MIESGSFRFGVAVLGAGASTRMGRPKLLLPWDGSTILGHTVNLWKMLGATQIGVVHAPGDRAIEMELDQLHFPSQARIANPEPARGMFSSILCAAQWDRWDDRLTHWIISLGDQPHLKIATLRQLLEFAALHREAICQPAFENRARHPVILPKCFWREIATMVDARVTLRAFLVERVAEILSMSSSDAGLALDVDTQDDYERALDLTRTDEEVPPSASSS